MTHTFRSRLANLVARVAALLVSTRRQLVRYTLSPAECATLGLPDGTTEPTVYVQPVVGCPWWRLDAWIDRHSTTEHCLRLDALGFSVEVYYHPRGSAPTVLA